MEKDAAEPTEPSIEAETQQPPVLPATEAKADHTVGMLCHLLSLTLLIGVPLGILCGTYSAVARLSEPGWPHLFGTDHFGRDSFSRALYGARMTVLIGLGAVTVALLTGGSVAICGVSAAMAIAAAIEQSSQWAK